MAPVHKVVASWFGAGLILGRLRGSHLGSGTIGAAVAFPMALLIGDWWGWQAQVVAAVVVYAAVLLWFQRILQRNYDRVRGVVARPWWAST